MNKTKVMVSGERQKVSFTSFTAHMPLLSKV